MKSTPIRFGSYKTAIVELKKGINENVSSLELEGGELIDCKNYMIAEGGYGGYTSLPGYERFDGLITPSRFESVVLTVDNCDAAILIGNLITGGISLATATPLEDGELISGAYVDGDAQVIVECLIATGSFDTGEALSWVGGTGTLFNATVMEGGSVDYHLALDFARTQVTEVPGEGPILGLHIYEKRAYVFRKKISLDEVGMYGEDITGWIEIDTSADPLVYSISSNRFKFSNYNFYATEGTFNMYWVDSVNQAREYNIATDTVSTIDNFGMSDIGDDAPTDIAAHNFHLFLGYRGGSLQHSQLGEPFVWDGVLGASEIGCGNTITNLVPGVQSSLLVYLTEGIRILHGNTIDDFVLEVFSETSGAFVDTAKRLLGTAFFVDDRGLSTMEAVQDFGDYAANSISQRFKQTLLSTGHRITQCTVSRDLNQYRIFFDDRQGIIVSFEGREFQGATFMEYPVVVNVAGQGEDEEKRDYIIFASGEDSGFVYRMDSGTSFDGTAITCRLSTAFYHYGSPRNYKAFKRATIEIAGQSGQEFDVKVDFDYNELGAARTIWYSAAVYTTEGGAVYSEGLWGIMQYGTGIVATNRVPVYLQGVGTNMSYKIISNETYRPQHVIQNIITDYELVGRRI